jgi:hypothetical protein
MTITVNSAQSFEQLRANIGTMTDEQLRKVEIHVKARLVFPKLAQAQAKKEDPNGRKTFGAVGIIPIGTSDELSKIGLNAMILVTNRFKELHHPNVPAHAYTRAYKNFKDCPTQDSGSPHPDFYKDMHWFNMSTGEKFPPQIYKNIGGKITKVEGSDPDLYFGQEVMFALSLYPAGLEAGSTKKKGVGANIKGVFILGGGARIESNRDGGDYVATNASAFAGYAGIAQTFDQGSVNTFAPQETVKYTPSNQSMNDLI